MTGGHCLANLPSTFSHANTKIVWGTQIQMTSTGFQKTGKLHVLDLYNFFKLHHNGLAFCKQTKSEQVLDGKQRQRIWVIYFALDFLLHMVIMRKIKTWGQSC
jgi:hypothetical protein